MGFRLQHGDRVEGLLRRREGLQASSTGLAVVHNTWGQGSQQPGEGEYL